jgi:hypothetical protein
MPHGHARNANGRPAVVLLLVIGLTLASHSVHAQAITSPKAIRQALEAGSYSAAETLAIKWVVSVGAGRQSDALALLRAEDLLVEARVKAGKGAAAATVSLARRIVRQKERRLGRAHLETSQSLYNLGLVRAARGEFAQAIPLFNRAIGIRRTSLGTTHPLVADALDQLASVLIQL